MKTALFNLSFYFLMVCLAILGFYKNSWFWGLIAGTATTLLILVTIGKYQQKKAVRRTEAIIRNIKDSL